MPMPSNEARCNLLPNRAIVSFWDALWLGIQPFLCSIVECRRIVIWRAQTIENEFDAESSDRELLGRPVARYSAVLEFQL